MSFAGFTLAQLWPIAVGGSLAITAMYLLRMRRRQVVVPFAALWEQVTRESESRELWRRLRRVLSWLVQIAVLLLICATLGDPRPEVWLREPTTVAIVIDRSASMAGLTEDGVTRLDAARTRVEQEIAGLGPVDRALVIAAGEEVGVIAPLSGDPQPLLAGLPALAPSYGEADLGRALALAHNAVAGAQGPRVLVITDGALDDAGLAALARCSEGELPCQVAQIDGVTDNLAITAFAARRYPNARDKIEVLAEVRNLGDAPAAFELDVEADGVSVGRRRIELLPGQSRREALADLDAARARFVARLREVDDAPPGFSSALGPGFDDIAYAVVPPLSPLSVVVVTDGTDLFLEAALLTQGEHVELVGITPEQGAAGAPALRDADVVVFDVGDGPLPASLPEAHVLIFDPWRRPGSPCPIARKAEVRRPFLTEQLREHPILESVVLKDVNIARGTTFALEPGDQALVRTLGEPIAVLREHGDHGLVAIGFDPRQSDLPLRVAFPVLVDNVLRWFEQREPGFVASVGLGHSRELSLGDLGLPVEGITRVRVEQPDGTVREQPVEHERLRLRALVPGFYAIHATLDDEDGDHEVTAELAVNQSGAAASDLHGRLGELPEGASAGAAPEPAPISQGPLWTAILLLAAAVVVIEWATYHRRITV
jgi:von Willebrand factor type A domain/Aerotolerance regulator N-terminal